MKHSPFNFKTMEKNKSITAIVDYLWEDELDFFERHVAEVKEPIENFDKFFEDNPQYTDSIVYHLYQLKKQI